MGAVIFDGLNWLREQIEVKNSSLRTLYSQQFAKLESDTYIWVWEGKGGNQRRRNLYPDYKLNRVKAHEDIFRSVKLFRDALAFAPVYQVHVDGYEGDDVVASLAKWFSELGPVTIWSTDKDFRSLCNGKISCSSNPVKEVDDCHVHLYKTLVGDPSDNIKGLQGFGHRSFVDHLNADYVQARFQEGNFCDFPMELAGLKLKHFNRLQEEEARVRLFWKITDFFDIPRHDIMREMKCPTAPNFEHGAALLNRYMVA